MKTSSYAEGGQPQITDMQAMGLLASAFLSILLVILVTFFKFIGILPKAWSWGAVLGGLFVLVLLLLLVARFLGFVGVVLFIALAMPLGVGYLVFGIPMLQHAAEQQALKSGLDGTAIITAASFNGLVNYQGEFTLTLLVTPQSGTAFSATTMVFGHGSSQTSPYPVGARVNVKYAPANHDVVILGMTSS